MSKRIKLRRPNEYVTNGVKVGLQRNTGTVVSEHYWPDYVFIKLDKPATFEFGGRKWYSEYLTEHQAFVAQR